MSTKQKQTVVTESDSVSMEVYQREIAEWDFLDSNREWKANNTVAMPCGHAGKSRRNFVRVPEYVVENSRANAHESRESNRLEMIFVIKLRTNRPDGEKTRRVYSLGFTFKDESGKRKILEVTGGYALPCDKTGNYVVADVEKYEKYKALLLQAIGDADIFDALHFSNKLGREKATANKATFQESSLDTVESVALDF